jgi:hypothetical protein
MFFEPRASSVIYCCTSAYLAVDSYPDFSATVKILFCENRHEELRSITRLIKSILFIIQLFSFYVLPG